jgi:TRAP-type C4-dicarboxylate transport system permease small subunit
VAKKKKSRPPRAVATLLSFDRGVTKASEALLIALFAAFISLSFFQVILRYIFHDTLAWADEFSRYAFIWSMFLGSALVVGKGFHITINVLTDALPRKLGIVWWLLEMLTTAVIAYVFIVYGWRIINLGWNTLTPASEVPIAYYQMIFVVFGVVSMFRVFVEMTMRYFGIESKTHTALEVQVD